MLTTIKFCPCVNVYSSLEASAHQIRAPLCIDVSGCRLYFPAVYLRAIARLLPPASLQCCAHSADCNTDNKQSNIFSVCTATAFFH